MHRPLIGMIGLAIAAHATAQTAPYKLKPGDFTSYDTLMAEARPGQATSAQFPENTVLTIEISCVASAPKLTGCRGQTTPGRYEQMVADQAANAFSRYGRIRGGINGPVTMTVRMIVSPE